MTTPTLNTSTVFPNAAGGSTDTRSFTVPSHTNGALVVQPFWCAISGTVVTITGITFGGVALTHVSGAYSEGTSTDGPSNLGNDNWILKNPSPSTANIVITYGTAPDRRMGMVAEVWDNVDQTTPAVNGNASGSATPIAGPTVAITNPAGSVAVGICSAYDAIPNLAASATAIGTRDFDGGVTSDSFLAQYSTATNPTLTWSLTAVGTGGCRTSGFSLLGFTGGGGSTSDAALLELLM